MAAAFPVFLGFAFVQMLENVIKTMGEWAGEAEESASADAKWERSVQASAEALDRMKEKLAALRGPLSEDAQLMKDFGARVVDISGSVKELNG